LVLVVLALTKMVEMVVAAAVAALSHMFQTLMLIQVHTQ
jgi:hypothetical protein